MNLSLLVAVGMGINFLVRGDWQSVVCFAVSVLIYAGVEVLNASSEEKRTARHDLEQRLSKIQLDIHALNETQRSFKETEESLTKQAEHVQKVLSQSNLAAAFARK